MSKWKLQIEGKEDGADDYDAAFAFPSFLSPLKNTNLKQSICVPLSHTLSQLQLFFQFLRTNRI